MKPNYKATARQLERELGEARQQKEFYAGAMESARKERDQLQSNLTQLQKIAKELAFQLEAFSYGEGDFQGNAINKALTTYYNLNPKIKKE